MQQFVLIKQINGFTTQSVDIHGFPTDEMLHFAFNLRRTGIIIGAVMGCFTFEPHQLGTAFGTFLNEFHFIADHESGIFVHCCNFWNNFSTFFHKNHIANV